MAHPGVHPSSSSSSLDQGLDSLSVRDHDTDVNQADLFAKNVDDVRPGQSSQNGNGQPSSKRQSVPSDEWRHHRQQTGETQP